MCTASVASASAPMVRGVTVMTAATRAARKLSMRSRARRRSPSVNTPTMRMPSSITAVMPMRLREISCTASASVAPIPTAGIASPTRMTSRTRVSSLPPSVPPGCERAKSPEPNPLACSRATASASPIASCEAVLAVGARLSGQASRTTLVSRRASASWPRVDSGFPVTAMRRAPRRLTGGRIARISLVSPEFEKATTTSSALIMPRSPWLASAGCTKNAGVPVEAKVAATLRAMCPDFPMPHTTTRPVQANSRSTANANEASSRWPRASTASASMRNTSRASTSVCAPVMRGACDECGTAATGIMRVSIANRSSADATLASRLQSSRFFCRNSRSTG